MVINQLLLSALKDKDERYTRQWSLSHSSSTTSGSLIDLSESGILGNYFNKSIFNPSGILAERIALGKRIDELSTVISSVYSYILFAIFDVSTGLTISGVYDIDVFLYLY
jgi:hypothetical protein